MLTLSGGSAGSLLLAAIGLYGLLAFNVAERRREIAVRLALGAEQSAILRMVVGQGLQLVAIGLVAGAITSFWVARALTSLLYQTEVARRRDIRLRAPRPRADLARRVRIAGVTRVTSRTDLRAERRMSRNRETGIRIQGWARHEQSVDEASKA